MKNKLYIYFTGIISGWWIMFIFINIIAKNTNKMIIPNDYPIIKIIIGILICVFVSIYAFNRK